MVVYSLEIQGLCYYKYEAKQKFMNEKLSRRKDCKHVCDVGMSYTYHSFDIILQRLKYRVSHILHIDIAQFI